MRRVFIFSEIEAERSRTEAEIRVSLGGGLHPRIVEAHAIDEGTLPPQAKEAGGGIARLRPRRDRPHLHESEAEREEPLGEPVAFVESSCDPDRGWKIQPAKPNLQTRISQVETTAKPGGEPREAAEPSQHRSGPAVGSLWLESEENALQKSEHVGGIYHSLASGEPMKNDRSKAPRDMRFPFSFVGRLSGPWEERLERFLSELNTRGETRLEEISRKLRQTDAWLRILSLAERVEKRREVVRGTWSRLGAGLLGRAGVATDAQFEALSEELQRLSWRLERLTQKIPKVMENQLDSENRPDSDGEFRSFG